MPYSFSNLKPAAGFVKNFFSQRYSVSLCALLTAISFTGNLALCQTQQNRYNVLFISVDDMNNKVGYLGCPAVVTPNLQRLLNRGTGFTNAFCQFSICNPSRISVMSGWRPDKTKVVANENDPASKVPSTVQYLQDYFHSFGYRTERYGKIYHEQFENEFTWDYFENYKDSSGNDFTAADNLKTTSSAGKGTHENIWGITPPDKFTNPDSIMATHLVQSMRTPGTVPRFFGIGLISPHAPFEPTIEYWNQYGDPNSQANLPYTGSGNKTVLGNSAEGFVLPNTPANDRNDIPAIAFNGTTTITMEDSEWRRTIQAYYAEVTLMDANLGIVLDELDRQNLWDNTVVIFVSDHGQHLGEHEGLLYKNSLFNEAQQVPMIICAPGKSAGISNEMVEEVDIYPTLTELCKLPTPTGLEGVSLSRLLDNPSQQWKKASFTQSKKPGSLYPLLTKPEGVFSRQYHYNYFGVYGEELYDRINDPFEYTNLAQDPAYANALDSMRNIRTGGWQNALPPACDSVIYYADKDGDGFGDDSNTFKGCYQPFGYIINGGDCNDANATINPNAQEVCDGIDNNCNGLTDENGIIATISPAGNVTVCSGQSLLLSANTGSEITYQWYKNNIAVAGAISATLTITTAGNYTVKETIAGGCSATSPAAVATAASLPAAKITVSGNLNICSTGSVTLWANAGTGYTYQWKKAGAIINGATDIQYTATAAGKYTVVVTNSSNCSKESGKAKVTSSCFARTAAGDVSISNLQTGVPAVLQLFPNPSSNGKATVKFYSDHTGSLQFNLCDIAGKCLYTKTVQVIKGNNTVLINPATISAGLYYLKMSGNKTPETKAFIVAP